MTPPCWVSFRRVQQGSVMWGVGYRLVAIKATKYTLVITAQAVAKFSNIIMSLPRFALRRIRCQKAHIAIFILLSMVIAITSFQTAPVKRIQGRGCLLHAVEEKLCLGEGWFLLR
ncbi:MAG: hypothetical protein JKY34_07450 [Kordiimonadaceae bacterium]|nr:hypothetical protein [Kordiimonadaceae bacterium]